ncbi:hypothetical protein GCM10010124_34230 [Pilimelia terevasa]|uniref:DNA-binding transcriptional regulator of glucitol operon n=1 Tax=Pilimelia terevasa TaxID=53372 RepID=A0A8J3FJB0_9ACTN|nr:hypothetical protein [Pilimelia terevasa]GGK38566.1 hypothetical protein GCM10010124_34230 [Pilimelia terevasa]
MRRLLTPAWLARHGLAAVLVPAFLGLGWWQFQRASSGNALSWAYTVQWPIFAGFVGFIWWREVRLALRPGAPAPAPARRTDGIRPPVLLPRGAAAAGRAGARGDAPDAALTAYNDYLAWLAAHPGARPGDYPGPAGRGETP